MSKQRASGFLQNIASSDALVLKAYESENDPLSSSRFNNALKKGVLALVMVVGASGLAHGKMKQPDVFMESNTGGASVQMISDSESAPWSYQTYKEINKLTEPLDLRTGKGLRSLAAGLKTLKTEPDMESPGFSLKKSIAQSADNLIELAKHVEQNNHEQIYNSIDKITKHQSKIGMNYLRSDVVIDLINKNDHQVAKTNESHNDKSWNALQVYRTEITRCMTKHLASDIQARNLTKGNAAYSLFLADSIMSKMQSDIELEMAKVNKDLNNSGLDAREAVAAYCANPDDWKAQANRWKSASLKLSSPHAQQTVMNKFVDKAFEEHAIQARTINQAHKIVESHTKNLSLDEQDTDNPWEKINNLLNHQETLARVQSDKM